MPIVQPDQIESAPDGASPPGPSVAARRSEPVAGVMTRPGRLPASTVHWAVLTLALPVLGEQLLWMLHGWSDLYLAKTIQPAPRNAMAAIGLGGQLMWLIQVVFSTVGIGATAIVARSIGAGDRRGANRAVRQALTLGLALGAATSGAVFFLAPDILWLFGLRGDALADAVVYVRILVPGMSIGVLEIIGAACLRGAGNTRAALLVVGLANVVNIALSWTLRYGWFGLPEMGLKGIAAGTLIAFIFGGLLMLWLLRRGLAGLKVRLWPLFVDLALVRRILRIGAFSGIEGAVMTSASMIVVAIVTHLGTEHIAAYIAAIRLESASFLPGMAFAVAGGALVGQSLGAGRPDRAVRCGWWAFIWGGGLMTLIGVAFVLAPGPLARLFTGTEPAVAARTATMLRICGLFQPSLAAILIFSGTLKGAGDTRYPMAITLSGVAAIRLPGAYLAAHPLGWGVLGVWWVMMGDLFARGALMAARFFHGGWKRTRV